MVEHRASVDTDDATVSIPPGLLERVEARVPRSGFESPDAYVAFVLEEVLARVESADDGAVETVSEAEVEQRLRSLGYLE